MRLKYRSCRFISSCADEKQAWRGECLALHAIAGYAFTIHHHTRFIVEKNMNNEIPVCNTHYIVICDLSFIVYKLAHQIPLQGSIGLGCTVYM